LILLALFSLLVGVIVLLAMRKTVAGPVPECSTCLRQQSARRRNVWIAWLGAIALFCVGAAMNSSVVALVGFVAVVAALLYGFLAPKAVQQGTVSKDGGWVELKGAAPAFAAAVYQQVAAATPLV
jgi:hypothetical protein